MLIGGLFAFALIPVTLNRSITLSPPILVTVNLWRLYRMSSIVLCFLFAKSIQGVTGAGGANVMGRVMGLILASLAVDNVLEAITGHFNLR